MDKNTLSNYGWIVIAVLVLSVMIALATPFGKYVESGVRSTTAGLFETSEKALNVVGMSAKTEQYYYDSLYDAVNALNNNDFTNASEDNTKNIVIIKGQGKFTIQLQQDVVETEMIEISSDCTINLNNFSAEIKETINFNENVKCTINDGTFLKNIDSDNQNDTLLKLYSNTSLIANKVNCSINNNAYVRSRIILIQSTTENATLLMNNCKLNTIGSENQNHTELTPKATYNIQSNGKDAKVVLNDCESTMTSVYMYNICCGNSTNIVVNNGYYKNTSIAKATNPKNPENYIWSTNVFYFTNNVSASLDNVTSDSECYYNNPQVNIFIGGNSTLNLKNSKISTIGNTGSFAYTVTLQGNQSENIPYAYIENCELLNNTTGNPRALHIYGQAKVDCIDSKLTSPLIGVFMNHLPQNVCNIKNSYIKAMYGVYFGSAENIYTEENVTYDVSERIFY